MSLMRSFTIGPWVPQFLYQKLWDDIWIVLGRDRGKSNMPPVRNISDNPYFGLKCDSWQNWSTECKVQSVCTMLWTFTLEYYLTTTTTTKTQTVYNNNNNQSIDPNFYFISHLCIVILCKLVVVNKKRTFANPNLVCCFCIGFHVWF